MCGRFTQGFSWDGLATLFGPLEGPPLNLRPRYNVAPGQDVVALRRGRAAPAPAMLRWGLVPAWAEGPETGRGLINARAETARGKPSFRAAFESRRCAIPADGFFEWRREGTGRQPYLFAMTDRRPFALAGLWERWTPSPGRAGLLAGLDPGPPLETCAVLTTEANALVAPVHHRMPAILDPGAVDDWLAGREIALGPFPAREMAATRVGTRVNSARHDDPRCIEPAAAVRSGRP